MIAGIAAIIVIAVLFVIFFMGNAGGVRAVPPESCAQQAIGYVNANLVQEGTSAELVSVKETSGLYEVTVRYRGSEIPLHVTKDCSLLFPSSYTLEPSAACDTQAGTCTTPAARTTAAPAGPVRSARPSVELYVMSFCPYGVQMENVMEPVVRLLRDSTDIRVRYIATVQGESIATAQSLHGNAEAVEDARQLCIAKYAPGTYWDYLVAFNARCYPAWNDAGTLAACQNNVTVSSGISPDTINRCAAGSEGLQMLRADQSASATNRATASPTLFINGQRYSGARTPEALKQAICDHFNTPPAACSTQLASQAAAASGNC